MNVQAIKAVLEACGFEHYCIQGEFIQINADVTIYHRQRFGAKKATTSVNWRSSSSDGTLADLKEMANALKAAELIFKILEN